MKQTPAVKFGWRNCKSLLHMLCFDYDLFIIYLFNDNLAAGGSLTGATLSCHVEV